MDERVLRLATPEQCGIFIENARARGRDDLVNEAHRRRVQIKVAALGAGSELERKCLTAIAALEEVLSVREGRKVSRSALLKKHGLLKAVDLLVAREADEAYHAALAALGLSDLAFEHVVAAHPEEFSFPAVERSRKFLAA